MRNLTFLCVILSPYANVNKYKKTHIKHSFYIIVIYEQII